MEAVLPPFPNSLRYGTASLNYLWTPRGDFRSCYATVILENSPCGTNAQLKQAREDANKLMALQRKEAAKALLEALETNTFGGAAVAAALTLIQNPYISRYLYESYLSIAA